MIIFVCLLVAHLFFSFLLIAADCANIYYDIKHDVRRFDIDDFLLGILIFMMPVFNICIGIPCVIEQWCLSLNVNLKSLINDFVTNLIKGKKSE